MNPEPFRFRLQRVRDLRKRSEDAAMQRLSDALSDQRAGDAALDAASAQVAEARTTQAQVAAGAATGADLLALQSWRERTEAARFAALDDARARRRAATERRSEAVEAQRDVQALDRLARKQRVEHAQRAERKLANLIDELATARYARENVAL